MGGTTLLNEGNERQDLSTILAEGFKKQGEQGKKDIEEVLIKTNDPIGYYTERFKDLYDLKGEYREAIIGFKKNLNDQITKGETLSDTQKQQAFAALTMYLSRNVSGADQDSSLLKAVEPNSWAQILLDKDEYMKYLEIANQTYPGDENLQKYKLLSEMLKKETYRKIFKDERIGEFQKLIDKVTS